jgi:solute:Na+ symporter, SSS family
MATLGYLDLIIMLCYLVMVVVIGLFFARRERSSEGYFLAGRSLTWPVIGASLFASNIGTEHLVGLAGDAHRVGLVAGGFEWMACLCLIILAVVFVPQYLRTRIYTIPEFLERRFSLCARMYLSGYFTVMIVLTKVSIALYAGALVMEQFFGWDRTAVMWGIGIFTAFYTAIGGLSAVVYTDVLQTVILVLGATLLTVIGLSRVGGWSELSASAPEGFLSMVKPIDHPDYPITGFMFGNLFVGIFYWCMDQAIVQRVLGARSIDHGRKGAIFGGFLKILPVFVFVLPGVIAVVLFPDIEHDKAFPTLVSELLPAGIKGLVLAGLLAALMSSLDSTLNASATLVTRDFFVRFSKTEPSQKAQIWLGRMTIAVVVIAGILWAPVIAKADTIWRYLQIVSAYMAVPIAAAVLTGVLWRRGNNAGALSAMVFGIAAGILMMVDSMWEGGLIPILQTPIMASFMHRSLLAFLLSVAVMVIVSLVTAAPPKHRLEGVCFEWRDSAPIAKGPILHDHRLWIVLLIVTVAFCWILFR